MDTAGVRIGDAFVYGSDEASLVSHLCAHTIPSSALDLSYHTACLALARVLSVCGVIEIPLPLVTELARQGAEIILAQTTFADVRVGDRQFRIKYEGKEEASLVPGRVTGLHFEREHEWLVDYREPWLDLLLSSAPDAAAEAEQDLARTVDEIFHGWRKLRRYANRVLADVLRDGFGLALRGPEGLAQRAEQMLRRRGARTQLRPSAQAPAQGSLSALVADRSFVIATAFRATSDA